MESTYYRITKVLVLLIMIYLVVLLLSGCPRSTQILKQENIQPKQSGSPTTSGPITFTYFTPLTLSIFQNTRNDNFDFSIIAFFYDNKLNNTRYGLLVQAGYIGNTRWFSSIENFRGELYTNNYIDNPPWEIYRKREFSVSEVNSVLNYLENNASYFFNGNEYEGIYPPPVKSEGACICQGNCIFTLSIRESGNTENAWGIHKCVDEYPEEGTPLYGLFQMLENDFITQFEE